MINELSLETVVKAVTREVLRELAKQGETRAPKTCSCHRATPSAAAGSERLDMGAYKTPIVTENSVRRLHELTSSIVVPAATRITPRAKELLREKNITIIFDTNK
jgi:hypothetical protein